MPDALGLHLGPAYPQNVFRLLISVVVKTRQSVKHLCVISLILGFHKETPIFELLLIMTITCRQQF